MVWPIGHVDVQFLIAMTLVHSQTIVKLIVGINRNNSVVFTQEPDWFCPYLKDDSNITSGRELDETETV